MRRWPWQVSYNSTINALELSHAWPLAVAWWKKSVEDEVTMFFMCFCSVSSVMCHECVMNVSVMVDITAEVCPLKHFKHGRSPWQHGNRSICSKRCEDRFSSRAAWFTVVAGHIFGGTFAIQITGTWWIWNFIVHPFWDENFLRIIWCVSNGLYNH